ncbi:methionine biosynthesis protein MetW [Congregibacter litoralis]|uniref:Methionine biosynthesis protein MetW n=1 Tax=Congregibacter litoralis KT71 TaxID=314285 RepID=A4A9D2_9GAMM|nr:methionine biosynthesis protein MetW [Congregibacter litoralis]EAQ97674.1 methionine biosynthesis protein MetW [Congregibacter litoralis KT71]
MRQDLTHILRWIKSGASVLDLGCGDGQFLALIQKERRARVMGIEIDPDAITQAMSRGLNIIEQNLDGGLANFPDQSFDMVVMAHALQAVHYPDQVLEEMLRVGRECVVTFPNFGHWRSRLHLATRGRMPVSRFMPYSWYDTPNIHFCTVRDFETLCAHRGIKILGRDMIGGNDQGTSLARRWPNLFATTAIYHISR